jgi:hypothetical protein
LKKGSSFTVSHTVPSSKSWVTKKNSAASA